MKNGMITDEYGTRRWYLDDKLHRTLGPAIEYANGDRKWYHHGKRHRADGPAVERANGTRRWYLNGVEYTFTEWLEHNTVLDPKKRILLLLEHNNPQSWQV